MCTTMVTRTRVKMEDRGHEELSRISARQQGAREPGGSQRQVRENGVADQNRDNPNDQSIAERRSLRAQYRALKGDIAEGKEVFTKLDSDGFDHVFSNVENLHNQVQRPREQIADAEALYDITATFLASVKDVRRGSGLSPAEFVTAMIRNFGAGPTSAENDTGPLIDWGVLGLQASAVFSDAPGMSSMLGPMDSQPKQRKAVQRRQRDAPVVGARPEELEDSTDTGKTETDKNMEIMFSIMRRLKSVPLEQLVLNRHSFSQTVENIFALSFLVKDGRAKISIENGQHIVAPKNFPSQQQRERGEGSMTQFVFRFDFKDWKIMRDSLEEGKELMPHRESTYSSSSRGASNSSRGGSRTPVRKNCRNRAKETPAADGEDQSRNRAKEMPAAVDGEDQSEEDDEADRPARKKMRSLAGCF